MTYDTEPLFVVHHQVEIAATASAVWRVLADTASYAGWNPYVLALEGNLAAGEELAVTITQDNWPQPITVNPTVIRAEPGQVLHWRGCLGQVGVLDTDHVFEIQELSGSMVRFVQYEEFRGTVAETIDAEQQEFTRQAFQAMNQALAAHVS